MTGFPDAPVTVTLSGEEWFAVSIVLAHGKQMLNRDGIETLADAMEKLAAQIGAASNAITAGSHQRPRLRVVETESDRP